MKVKYTDPYEIKKIEVELPDDTPMEELNHVLDVLEEDARQIMNAERRERYHAPYHKEAMEYEGDSMAYRETPERILIRKEEWEQISSHLSQLTDTQLHRLLMKASGMTYRQIAEAEGTNINAIRDSVEAARKKLQKCFKNTCTKH